MIATIVLVGLGVGLWAIAIDLIDINNNEER